MKRGADFGGGRGRGGMQANGIKRFRGPGMGSGAAYSDEPSKPECRILIPSRAAGRIIGKGGENVKRLRTEFKANVTIPDSTAPERIVCITGEIDSMADVATDVLGKLEESRLKDAPDERECELKVLVHKSLAGAVIGKGGAKIKELRESTKTNVKVFPSSCPMSTDRVVGIAGAKENQIQALKEVLKAVGESLVKGDIMQYDTNSYDGANLSEYGGYPPDRNWRGPMHPVGAGGPLPMGGHPGFGVGMGMNRGPGGPQSAYGVGAQSGFGSGQPGYGGAMGQYMNSSAGMNMQPSGAPGLVPPMGQGMPISQGMGMGQPMSMGPTSAPNVAAGFAGGMAVQGGADPSGMQTSRVTIPKELAGTIIGKGGERLKSIKQESGALVIVEPLEQGANDRIITIKGTPQCIQMAQYLLQQCVRSSQYGQQYR